jgi:hypothetical protein
MVRDLSFTSVNEDLLSWQVLRQIKNCEQVFGTMLYQK